MKMDLGPPKKEKQGFGSVNRSTAKKQAAKFERQKHAPNIVNSFMKKTIVVVGGGDDGTAMLYHAAAPGTTSHVKK